MTDNEKLIFEKLTELAARQHVLRDLVTNSLPRAWLRELLSVLHSSYTESARIQGHEAEMLFAKEVEYLQEKLDDDDGLMTSLRAKRCIEANALLTSPA